MYRNRARRARFRPRIFELKTLSTAVIEVTGGRLARAESFRGPRGANVSFGSEPMAGLNQAAKQRKLFVLGPQDG